MRKSSSVAAIIVVIITLGLMTFFARQPIANNLDLGLDLKGGLHVVLQADESKGQAITQDTIKKSVGIIRERVDKLGVEEPLIYPQGSNRIVVELAGVNNPEEAVNIIKNTAQLEFWDEEGNILLTGENLKDAQAEVRQGSGAVVNLEFDKKGTELFATATQNNIDKRIAIVIDNNIVSAPFVREAIPSGRAEISGSFTAEEAQNLAVLLRSGALPVSFNMLEKRTVGPTLGADSLEKSLYAGLVGLIAVLVFMLLYYRLPGIVADLSLVLYSLLVLGTMALLGSVLTLPGIAGFALSIGMAVDANVIIYERIKEEIRTGKSLRSAIDAGFKRAYWTIFDANLTTLITAGVLMYFGTGPIKGFAVTLSIGIIASMLIALTFTRYMIGWLSNIWTNTKLYGA